MYNNSVGGIDAQLAGLRAALMIATILDRVLILPRFHCFNNSTRSFVECPLNSLLNIIAFDAGFAGHYRESSFLRHPLVPDAVRRSISRQYVIATPPVNGTDTIPVSSDHSNTTNVVRRNNTGSISDDELRQLLGTDQHRIVSLATLDHVRVTFKSAAQQQTFNETVRTSFKRSDYRQLHLFT